jgi:hypothetical protein
MHTALIDFYVCRNTLLALYRITKNVFRYISLRCFNNTYRSLIIFEEELLRKSKPQNFQRYKNASGFGDVQIITNNYNKILLHILTYTKIMLRQRSIFSKFTSRRDLDIFIT